PSRDHLNLSAKRTGEVHTGVVRLYPKLFQAFYRSGHYCSGSSLEAGVVAAASLHVAGGVATIEHESVLVHARPSDGSATRVAEPSLGRAWTRTLSCSMVATPPATWREAAATTPASRLLPEQ